MNGYFFYFLSTSNNIFKCLYCINIKSFKMILINVQNYCLCLMFSAVTFAVLDIFMSKRMTEWTEGQKYNFLENKHSFYFFYFGGIIVSCAIVYKKNNFNFCWLFCWRRWMHLDLAMHSAKYWFGDDFLAWILTPFVNWSSILKNAKNIRFQDTEELKIHKKCYSKEKLRNIYNLKNIYVGWLIGSE